GGRAVAEEADVASGGDPKRARLPVPRSGHLRLARSAHGSIERERDRYRERIVRGDPAGMAHHERRVRIVLAGEVRELRAEQPAGIGRQSAVEVRQRIAKDTGGELLELAV